MRKRRSVKQNNRKVILDYARGAGSFSIADVSAETRISKTTVKKVLDFYLGHDFVLISGKGGSSDEGGKRPLLFQFNREKGFVVSVHLGPGFVKAVLTNLAGEKVHSVHCEIEASTAEKAADQVAGIINDLLAMDFVNRSQVLACVLAVPSVVDPGKGISVFSPHYRGWGNDVLFRDMVMEKVSAELPFYFDNVNRFQAFAEQSLGCAGGSDNFLIIDAIEEGVGAGVVVNGTLRHGSHNLSGEIGHMILSPHEDASCICGGKGCFEAMVSLKRIKRLAEEGKAEHPGSLIFKKSPDFELEDLFTAAQAKDALAVSILEDVAFWFALGLNNIIMVNDPNLVIIQGIYTAAGDWFLERVQSLLDNLSFPGIKRSIDIVYSTLGSDRCVLGGAVYAIWDYFESSDIYGNVS